MANDLQQGQANTNGHAGSERKEDGSKQDDSHKAEFFPSADLEEEVDVVRAFFDKGPGDDTDERRDDGFLMQLAVSIVSGGYEAYR